MPEPITNDTTKSAQVARLGEDEVSLRELYLIFRRGLPWILGAALLAGTLMFVLTLRHVSVFEASATVLVSPLPVESTGAESEGVEEAQLTLGWGGAVPFEVYNALASSQEVLENAVSRASDANVDAAQLGAAGRVGERTRPNRADDSTPLVFAHVVSHPNPDAAAALANAWATSTTQAVHRVRRASLAEIEEAARVEAERLGDSLQTAETQWQDFQAQNRSSLAAARAQGLTTELVAGETQLRSLAREVDASRAKLETLRAQRQTNTPSSVADVQREEITLAGLLAERESLEAQLQQIEETLAQPTSSGATQESQLRRAVEQARAAFMSVSEAQTRAAYLREIVPTTAQVLDRAQVPAAPLDAPGFSRVILAAFAGALLATLLIFLRAAVRPVTRASSTPEATPSQTTLSESRG